jgi:hypothetical protein
VGAEPVQDQGDAADVVVGTGAKTTTKKSTACKTACVANKERERQIESTREKLQNFSLSKGLVLGGGNCTDLTTKETRHSTGSCRSTRRPGKL